MYFGFALISNNFKIYITMSNVTSSTAIDTSLIVNWNNLRTNQSNVISTFETIGNNFSFTWPTNVNEDVHVYIGINRNGDAMTMYLVKESQDNNQNGDFTSIGTLSNTKDKLPQEQGRNTNPDSIPWSEANTRVNNWIDDNNRKQWITNQFATSPKPEDAILLAFKVNALDIIAGQSHTGFLALSGNTNTGFAVDLIVVNSNGNILLTQDMVHSVPPFGDSYPSYGLLNQLNIH